MENIMDKLMQMEVEYVKNFSKVIETDHALLFIDEAIPDMYTHNYVFYQSAKGLVEYIENELRNQETKDKGFFRIETPYPISEDLLEKLSIKPEVCIYDFMWINTVNHENIGGNPNCSILNADTKKVIEDGIRVDIQANTDGMGLDFAERRIIRKALAYNDLEKAVQLFVCYSEGIPIGNIEYMPFNEIVKLEDFNILEDYQKKGFGTSVLKHLVAKAFNEGIDYAYLITEQTDTAKEMYKKCGFEKVGEKTELMFLFQK
ncbi:GNAT family N-acetyltransferase [Anaerobacillus sp. CMMVII]|uniref:GNAT family N-acetyltransferase n=1 Tax=Anaerobacillus sp. CMMVII TaxID=2755588 RepID=UPI0021B7840B|nr:GNAT family N-acetyltransferase [Anaerobacillus sp. CMMVII]MCT8138075.1 GNAT family N-acetyltransferase [Anaerobacillus sp. CMMVII]